MKNGDVFNRKRVINEHIELFDKSEVETTEKPAYQPGKYPMFAWFQAIYESATRKVQSEPED
jgi:hypothetical protein